MSDMLLSDEQIQDTWIFNRMFGSIESLQFAIEDDRRVCKAQLIKAMDTFNEDCECEPPDNDVHTPKWKCPICRTKLMAEFEAEIKRLKEGKE